MPRRVLRITLSLVILTLFAVTVSTSASAASCNMITRLGDQTATCPATSATMPMTTATPAPMPAASTMPSSMPSMPSMPMATGPFDQQFIDMMVPHHMMAVAMAQMAIAHATHPELKTLAQSIIASQNDEIGQMKQWRKAWFGSDQTPSMDQMPMLAGMPDSDMMAMMHMMQDMQGLDTANPFDKAFMQLMIPHHQSAVDAAKIALTQGQHPEIKTLATSIISDQQKEIAQMQGWLKAWYGQ